MTADLKSYLGSPVQVIDAGTDAAGVSVSAVVKVEIIATTDLESYDFPQHSTVPAVPPVVAPPAVPSVPTSTLPTSTFPGKETPQQGQVVTADYQGPDRRVSQRRSGVERRVA